MQLYRENLKFITAIHSQLVIENLDTPLQTHAHLHNALTSAGVKSSLLLDTLVVSFFLIFQFYHYVIFLNTNSSYWSSG